MVEGPDQPPPAVHPEVAGGPDHRRPDVDDERRVGVGELVQQAGDVLRVHRSAPAVIGGELVEPSPGRGVHVAHLEDVAAV